MAPGPGRAAGSARSRSALAALLGAFLLASLAPAVGAEVIKGSAKDERIDGTDRNDRIMARGGDDRARGLDGADKLNGGGGNDKLVGGDGRDTLLGKDGNDKLKSRDGRRDKKVDGGDGDDICIADLKDAKEIAGCETVSLENQGSGKGSGGGGAGGGGGGDGGGGGGGGDADGKLTISKVETRCSPDPSPQAGCQFTVEGTGADTPQGSVTVTSDGETTGGGPAGADPSSGEYQGAGAFSCPATGALVKLTVEFGEESAFQDTPCTSTTGSGDDPPEPPDPPDPGQPPAGGPLTITSMTSDCETDESTGALCRFHAEGTGATEPSGSATVRQQGNPSPVVGGGAVAGDPATGAFEVDGSYGCQMGTTVTLTVQMATAADTFDKACGAA